MVRGFIKVIVILVSIFVIGCGNQVTTKRSTIDAKEFKKTDEIQKADLKNQKIIGKDEKILLDHFNTVYPNSIVIDRYYDDIDNDMRKELLLALNTYSGADKKRDKEVESRDGMKMLYVAIVIPRGSQPKEGVIVLGKSLEEGMSFTGTNLFNSKKVGNKVDHIEVRAQDSRSNIRYFTMKVTLGKNGIRSYE